MTESIFTVSAGNDDGRCQVSTGSFYDNNNNFLEFGKNGTIAIHSYFRFDNVTIPKGANIDSCVLRCESYDNRSTTTVNVTIYCEDADNPTYPTNGSDLIGRALTSGTNWNGIGSWTFQTKYDSVDFASELQTVIDRAGWNSGQAVIVHVKDNGSSSSAERRAGSYEYSATTDPVDLVVNWSVPFKPYVFENIEITEDIQLAFDLVRQEEITVTEFFDIVLGFGEFLPTISENIDISEYVDLSLSVSDIPDPAETINISEFVQIALGFEINVFETITISESGNIRPEIETHETLTVTEYLDVKRGYDVDQEEEAQLSDRFQVFNYTKWIRDNIARSNERYFFTLTGSTDQTSNVQIPISSIYARKRTGAPTYLQVVVPSFNYAQQIQDRPNGEMIVELAYEVDGEIGLQEEILIADLEDIRLDEGPVNRSVTLTGHKTISYGGQLVTFRRDQATYRSVQTRARVYRFAHIDPFVNPGDTVIVGDEQFTCDNIIYIVNKDFASMEIREGA